MKMAKVKKTKEQIIRENCEPIYGEFTVEQLKNEILFLLKKKEDNMQAKKDYMASYGEIIKETNDRIRYCAERINHIQHEEAVQVQLANAQ